MSESWHVNDRTRCIGADQARKIGSTDPMAANGKPSKNIIFSGGEAARSAFGRQLPPSKYTPTAAKRQNADLQLNISIEHSQRPLPKIRVACE